MVFGHSLSFVILLYKIWKLGFSVNGRQFTLQSQRSLRSLRMESERERVGLGIQIRWMRSNLKTLKKLIYYTIQIYLHRTDDIVDQFKQ